MTPVRGDNEKHASASERNAYDDRSRRRHLEGRDLSGDEPDTGKQDQQETDLGEFHARLMTERKHRNDGSYFDRSLLPGTRWSSADRPRLELRAIAQCRRSRSVMLGKHLGH
jgi:hypothetical protein